MIKTKDIIIFKANELIEKLGREEALKKCDEIMRSFPTFMNGRDFVLYKHYEEIKKHIEKGR